LVNLYRNSRDLEHWFVRIPGTGWARFPAKPDGWAEHAIVTLPAQQYLNRVPLWLAFNTGLLEWIQELNLEPAA